MAQSVEMPELGESVTEGTITQWLKKVGDKVEVDEPLLEVSTDKVDTEIPSPVAGVLLKVMAEEDDTIEVGSVIAEIGEEDEAPSSDDEGDDSSDEDETADSSDEEAAEESEDDSSDESSENSASEGSGEGEDVTMPELGESVTEGTITQWLKSVGDKVEVDEPLLEVSTDKVDTEIPSPVAGTLVEILAEEDDTVEVGDVIARIGDGSGKPAKKEEPKADEPEETEDEDVEDSSEDASEDDSSDESSDDSSSDGSGEGEDVTMPELGESVTEGTITQWLKSVGDKVEVDEPLLEVSTDKVDTEIPSPVAGTLVEILAEEDDTVEVGDVIARIGDGSGKPAKKEEPKKEKSEDKSSEKSEKKDEQKSEKKDDSKQEQKSEKKDSGKDKAEAAREAAREKAAETTARPNVADRGEKSGSAGEPSGDNLPYVTPLVRKLAEKNNVDLSKVTGTGVGGRIRKQDVLAAAEGEDITTGAKTNLPAGPRASAHKVDPDKQELIGTTQKVNRIREITARTTLESLRNSAQLTQVHEVDMTLVADLRAKSKKAFQDAHGVNLTFLPFFAKAAIEALISHPNVNASYNAESKEMTYHDRVNLSIAVDTKDGLLSPVIHDAQDLSLPELAKAIADIAHRARNKKLKPNEVTGGTFTITNIGSEGALTDTPILVPPQAAMVGTGAIVKRPVVLTEDENEAIAIRDMVFLPLTYDHQVIDGADAGRFMSTLRDRLEKGDFEDDLEL